jgi:DNA-directed RNA polymerase specialized sigma24 family protein
MLPRANVKRYQESVWFNDSCCQALDHEEGKSDMDLQDLYERYVRSVPIQSGVLLDHLLKSIQSILIPYIRQNMRGRSLEGQQEVYHSTIAVVVRKIQESRTSNLRFRDLRAYIVTIARYEILHYCHQLDTASRMTVSLEELLREGDGPVTVPMSLQAGDVATGVLLRDYLHALWQLLRKYPENQTAALLLHARDVNGTSMVELLEMCRIASHSEMAEAIGMTPAEFGHWRSELPSTDARIAERYCLSANSVAVRRKRVRAKLQEQMEEKP